MQRKKRTHLSEGADPSKKGDPKSFVLRRGRHSAILKDLEKDIRTLMSPNTAANLREHRKNTVRDFIEVAGPLGISHLLILTATQTASYLRMAKTPRGPTLTLRIHEHSLMRDVLGSQPRPRAPKSMWLTPPLVVMNNFGGIGPGTEHLKLATTMFQNLFPALNVQSTKLSACQRVLLLDRDPSTGRISLRHYSISVAPSGVTKNLKKLLGRKDLPEMGRMADISELLTKSGYGSESEGEDADASKVMLAQDLGKGNIAARQSRVKLHEVGPRIELEIYKVEEGLCDGKVLYHAYEKRSAQEIAAQQAEFDSKEALRERRRKEQEENVRRKEAERKRKDRVEKEELEVARKKKGGPSRQGRKRSKDDATTTTKNSDDDDDEYYRQEVGEEPDEGFKMTKGKKVLNTQKKTVKQRS